MKKKTAKEILILTDYALLVGCCWLTARFPDSNWPVLLALVAMAELVHSIVDYAKFLEQNN